MIEVVTTSPWAHLALCDLEQLIIWLDWSEHHAMLEHSISDPIEEIARKRDWDREVRKLSRVQSELRQIWESRTGRPLSRTDRSY